MAKLTHKQILVVDDEPKIREILRDILEHKGYAVLLAENGLEAMERLQSQPVDLMLLDLVMPGLSGMEVLEGVMKKAPWLPVIMVTAHGDIPLAVKATQLGAVDFIEKPVEMHDLLSRIETQFQRINKKRGESLAVDEGVERYGFVGVSEPMRTVCKLIDQAAKTEIRILITGETGTGKELVAKAVHDLGRRRDKKFVKVNCAAIPEELIESELFGHMRGAFTGAFANKTGKFQQAHGGTLFLDEVADMSPMTQAKVLRALEDGEIQPVGGDRPYRVDVRVVAATNKNLKDMAQEGVFREDLYYRLNVVNIHLPKLSERKTDIPHLVEYYLQRFAEDYNLRQLRVSSLAMEALLQKTWSGNIRELRNFLEKLVVFADSDLIDALHVKRLEGAVQLDRDLEQDLPLQEARDRFEREYIHNKLLTHDWSVGRVAKILDVDRTTLYRKMQQLGIENQ